MPRWPPLHPDYVIAIRALDAAGLPYAALWRALIPVAARLSVPRPSYSTVRRVAIAERRRKDERTERLELILGDLLVGLSPMRGW